METPVSIQIPVYVHRRSVAGRKTNMFITLEPSPCHIISISGTVKGTTFFTVYISAKPDLLLTFDERHQLIPLLKQGLRDRLPETIQKIRLQGDDLIVFMAVCDSALVLSPDYPETTAHSRPSLQCHGILTPCLVCGGTIIHGDDGLCCINCGRSPSP